MLSIPAQNNKRTFIVGVLKSIIKNFLILVKRAGDLILMKQSFYKM